MAGLRFDLRDTPAGAPALRATLRAFLAEAGRDWPPIVPAYSWMGFDRDFSREVGKRGWIGMTWPAAYGGGERSAMERYVVLEEMLAVGAPVGAHWIGDRQSGPSSSASAPRSSAANSSPASSAASWPSPSASPSPTAAPTSPACAPGPRRSPAAGASTAARSGPPTPTAATS
ncbi:acyl-CoA dehydrogenase family protein [Paeniroseomonas aquatica]|uniref:acyl-CoA dehydrogenase family protein n=1 Tax=Paeniroseomonas aquatica TaxID=373043 RepID=UPI0036149891